MMNATETTAHSFEVGSAPQVRLRNMAGNVQIAAGNDGSIGVVVTKKANSNEALTHITVEMRQDGDQVFIEGKLPNILGILKGMQRSIDFVITLPPLTALDLGLNAGDMRVSGARGALQLDHNAGNARLENLICNGPTKLSMNAGDLTLEDVTFTGDTQINQNAGNVRGAITLAPGVGLDIKMNAGDVRLTLPRETAAHVTARVTAGDIHIDGFAPVAKSRRFAQASAEGDLAPNPQGAITIKLTAGDVRLSAR